MINLGLGKELYFLFTNIAVKFLKNILRPYSNA